MEALPDFELLSPTTLDEVVAARKAHPAARLLGGGTDLVVNIRRGIEAPPVLIAMARVAELRTIRADAEGLEIGAAVTLAELAQHPGVMAHYPVVAQAAASIAGPTHRTMGTVGGNLCLDTRCIFYNQSEWWRAANNHCLKTTGGMCHVAPRSRGVCFATFSGDLAPALMALDAEVDLAGPTAGAVALRTSISATRAMTPAAATASITSRSRPARWWWACAPLARRGPRAACARPTTRCASAARSNIPWPAWRWRSGATATA
jgi:4-hydroxybenzoyl-CoA reductase beta subunit